jgi:hypothetical protein
MLELNPILALFKSIDEYLLATFELHLKSFVIRSLLLNLLHALFQEIAFREHILDIFSNRLIHQRQLLARFLKVFIIGTNHLAFLSQIRNNLKDAVSVFLSPHGESFLLLLLPRFNISKLSMMAIFNPLPIVAER